MTLAQIVDAIQNAPFAFLDDGERAILVSATNATAMINDAVGRASLIKAVVDRLNFDANVHYAADNVTKSTQIRAISAALLAL